VGGARGTTVPFVEYESYDTLDLARLVRDTWRERRPALIADARQAQG
jgi:hypothetical protein